MPIEHNTKLHECFGVEAQYDLKNPKWVFHSWTHTEKEAKAYARKLNKVYKNQHLFRAINNKLIITSLIEELPL